MYLLGLEMFRSTMPFPGPALHLAFLVEVHIYDLPCSNSPV